MTAPDACVVNVTALGRALRRACPEALFALLHGSARTGVVQPGSDLDIALLLKGKPTLLLYQRVWDAVAQLAPQVACDLGILNGADPIYCFEALRGRLLFARRRQAYLTFFSNTCRAYERQIAEYQRQRHYRRAFKPSAPPRHKDKTGCLESRTRRGWSVIGKQ